MSEDSDRRGGLVGLGVALALLVGFVGYLSHALLITVAAAVVVLAIGVGLWWLWDRPERGPKMESLSSEEQARRREAGRILKEIVPPVSESEARRMLAPPWERGPDDWPQRP